LIFFFFFLQRTDCRGFILVLLNKQGFF
jgi:hypothetical protein